MPRIPTRTAQVSPTTELLRVPVSADAFGAQIGRAQQEMGAGLASVGSGLNALAVEVETTRQQQEVAANVASADYTKRDLERKQAAPADGSGFYKSTDEDYTKWVDEQVNGIADPKVRQATKTALLARKPSVMSSAANYETTQQVNYSKLRADEALNAVENRVRTNPAEFDQALKDSHALIDSRTEIPAQQREAMKIAQTQLLSKRTFEARIGAAQTPEQMDQIVKELEASDDWKKRMSPADYDRMLDGAKSGRSALNTRADTEARAALESVSERNRNRQVLDPAELAAVEATVKQSKNPGLQWQLTELKEQQAIYRQYRGLTPQQYDEKVQEARGQRRAAVPGPVADAINNATTRTGISASYLAGLFNKEYGAGLYAAQGAGSGNLEGTSSAVGIAQFTKGTAVRLAKSNNGFYARVLGIDIAGKSDDEIHAMFKDPKVAMTGAALLARENANQMQRDLGRPVSDGEMYLAHFLGAGGATTLIRAVQADPNQLAATIMPQAAAANKGIFFDKETGRGLTVAQLYSRVTSSFMGGPSRVGEVRAQAIEGMRDQQAKAVKEDMIGYGASTGRFQVNALTDPASFAERGRTYTSMADYFAVPRSDGDPFTKDEAAALVQQIKNGTADDALAVLTSIQAMGGDASRAAARQIGLADPVFGFAAGLAANRGAQDVAGDVIRGQKRIEADKDVKAAIGDAATVTNQFNSIVGKALVGADPRAVQAIKDAALAHYVETHVSRSSGKFGVFDKNAYAASINAVMGGQGRAPAVDSVNGEPTVVPPGVSGREFDAALDRFTVDDYTRMSKDGKPPRYADGTEAKPEDIAVEGKFRSIGANEYLIEMGDGRFLLSEITSGRTARPYRFMADPEQIKRAAKPPAAPPSAEPEQKPVEAPSIMQPGGALPNFDPATGAWKGPAR
jgi:hypothetical protein